VLGAGDSFGALEVIYQNTRPLILEVTDFMLDVKQHRIMHVLCWASSREDAWWNGGRATCVIDLGVRWWLDVSCLPQPLYSWFWIGSWVSPRIDLGAKARERQFSNLLKMETFTLITRFESWCGIHCRGRICSGFQTNDEIRCKSHVPSDLSFTVISHIW